MTIGPHFHQCSSCGSKTECCGEIRQNYDRVPPWICLDYHLSNGEIDTDFVCDACFTARLTDVAIEEEA